MHTFKDLSFLIIVIIRHGYNELEEDEKEKLARSTPQNQVTIFKFQNQYFTKIKQIIY